MSNVKKQTTVFKLRNGDEVSVSLSCGSHVTTEVHEQLAARCISGKAVDTYTKVLYG